MCAWNAGRLIVTMKPIGTGLNIIQGIKNMPSKPKRLCLTIGCRKVTKGNYCDACKLTMQQRAYSYDHGRPCPARRGYDHQWRKVRAQYLERNPFCVQCGGQAKHVDHIVPLRVGGENHERNYQSLCHSCHSAKTAKENRLGKHVR